MENISVRKMKCNDIDEVLHIEKKSFTTPWSRLSFEKEIEENELAEYVVAQVNNEIVGYGGLWIIIDEGHITNIAVHPQFRNKGIGSKIVNELINICENKNIRKITLEVRRSNESAILLYNKFGFEPCGIRRGYYKDTNEDAIIMWRRD